MQTKQPCVCGRAYWPAQAWQHEKCGAVVNLTEAAVSPIIVDPAKPKFDRNSYMREYMRKRRAAKP